MNPCILNRCCGWLFCMVWGAFVLFLAVSAIVAVALSLGGCALNLDLMPT